MTPAIWLNLLFLLIALGVAAVFLLRDHRFEKARENWVKSFARYAKSDEYKERRSYAAQFHAIEDPHDALPRLDREGFAFVDLAHDAIDNPPEIALPPLRAKRAMAPGDQVLVRMVFGEQLGESEAWVQVNAVLDGDLFAGEIVGVSSEEGVLLAGEPVVFSANHIGLIERPSQRPLAN